MGTHLRQPAKRPRAAVSQLRLHSLVASFLARGAFPVMKGHEDGGMFFGQEEEVRERFFPP